MLNKLALSASVIALAGSLAVAPSGRSMAAVNGGVKTGHWGGAKPDQLAAWA